MHCAHRPFRSVATCVIVAGASRHFWWRPQCRPSTKAPAHRQCVQAVDGMNGKLAGFGGSFADHGVCGAIGSLIDSARRRLGFQFDVTGASFNGRFLGAAPGHLFRRDPAKALFGVYGSYTYWDQVGGVRIATGGPEVKFGMGRWTLQGVAGVEFGNNASGTVGGRSRPLTPGIHWFFYQVNRCYH